MKKADKISTLEMEVALSEYLNPTINLIVPNISWGMDLHECDLLSISKCGYASEIEIKISKADLIKDKDKKHGHRSPRIKYLYFAIPEYLVSCQDLIPERAGIIIVERYESEWGGGIRVKKIRDAQKNGNYKFTEKEMLKVARLGTMRIWGLKRKITRGHASE